MEHSSPSGVVSSVREDLEQVVGYDTRWCWALHLCSCDLFCASGLRRSPELPFSCDSHYVQTSFPRCCYKILSGVVKNRMPKLLTLAVLSGRACSS